MKCFVITEGFTKVGHAQHRKGGYKMSKARKSDPTASAFVTGYSFGGKYWSLGSAIKKRMDHQQIYLSMIFFF